MGSATTDRRMGLTGDKGMKAPVACATTANITLSGEQTIDGVVTSTSRVLVKNQSDATQNGVYDSSSAAWTRAIDCDGNQDLVTGTIFLVTGGSTQGNQFWQVISSNPITIGSSAINFSLSFSYSASLQSYTPGGTGAVVMSVQTKLREIASVKDFGVKGDGVTDDTANIQVAKNSLLSLHYPAGKYINSGVTIPNEAAGATYYGDGFSHFNAAQQTTIIAKIAGQSSIFTLASSANNITFTNMRIDGNHLAQVGVMGIPQVGFATFDTVGVYNCTAFGLLATGGLWRLNRCFIQNDDVGAQIYSDSAATDCEFTGGNIPLLLVSGGNRFSNTWANTGALCNLKLTPLSGNAWAGTTAYKIGQCVTLGGNMYFCSKAGTSASSGGPTGTTYGLNIADGTVIWNYMAAINGVSCQNNAFVNLYIGETSTAGSLTPNIILVGSASQYVVQTQITNMYLVHASGANIMGGIYAAFTQDTVISNFTVLGQNTNATAARYTAYFWNGVSNCINTTISNGVIRGVNQNPFIHGGGGVDLQLSNIRFDRCCETYASGTQQAMFLLTGGGLRLNVTACTFVSYGAGPYITEGGSVTDFGFEACEFTNSNAIGLFQTAGVAQVGVRGSWRIPGNVAETFGPIAAQQVYTQKGQVVCGAGAVTVSVLTLPTLSASQSYMIFFNQAGGTGANATVGAFWLWGTAGGAATIGNANTATLQNTITASGATIQFTQGAGYGATSWDWTLIRIG